jgi:hypothetical protein
LLQRRRDPKGASPKTPRKDRRERPGRPFAHDEALSDSPLWPSEGKPCSRYRLKPFVEV